MANPKMFEFRITHGVDVPDVGRSIERHAVRAVVRDGPLLLMIHSPIAGDYKFPGGGVEEGETVFEALSRELEEEAGAILRGEPKLIGRTVERMRAKDEGYDLFLMRSDYYEVSVAAERCPQRLDRYEAALGFRPVWIEAASALAANAALLAAGGTAVPRWTRREALVLERLTTATTDTVSEIVNRSRNSR
jgi:8-oxo-dGTP pyrophosphatase MutT (NUDIX family)